MCSGILLLSSEEVKTLMVQSPKDQVLRSFHLTIWYLLGEKISGLGLLSAEDGVNFSSQTLSQTVERFKIYSNIPGKQLSGSNPAF